MLQLTLGIALGIAATSVLVIKVAPGTELTPLQGRPLLLASASAVVVLVGVIVCVAPTLLGLRSGRSRR